MDWTGKGVIVTGASRGIGAATARHLAGLGAAVTLAARDEAGVSGIAAEIAAAGGRARGVGCDVADAAAVQALVEGATDWAGAVDVLVSNAGLIDPISHLADSDPEGWARAVNVNLTGAYLGMRFVLPQMLARGSGTVLTISSGAALRPVEGWSHYCASKAGALALTRCADLECRAQGVRVLGLSPGTVATDMQRKIAASGINPISKMAFSDHIPPEWVAQAVAWACTPAADAHLGDDIQLRDPKVRAAVGLPEG